MLKNHSIKKCLIKCIENNKRQQVFHDIEDNTNTSLDNIQQLKPVSQSLNTDSLNLLKMRSQLDEIVGVNDYPDQESRNYKQKASDYKDFDDEL